MKWPAPAALAAGIFASSCTPMKPVADATSVDTAISAAASRAFALGKAKQLTPDGVTVRIETKDRYGKAAKTDALRFRWDQFDLNRISWSSVDRFAVLDLARPEILNADGITALGSWCVGRDRADALVLTPNMCGAPYAAAIQRAMSTQTPKRPESPK